MTEALEDSRIAQPEEVLRVMTSILRGECAEDGGVKSGERYKAAELLGKHYGLFERRESPSPDALRVSREIGRMLTEMADRAGQAEGPPSHGA